MSRFAALLAVPFTLALLAGCSVATEGASGSTEDDLSASKACTATSPRATPIELAVLPEAGESPFVDNLATAKKTIDVMVYMMGTDGVYDTLIERHQHGVTVRVILDGRNERAFNQPAFDGLTAAGIQVQWSSPKFSFMHAKTFVVDGKLSVISTGNYPKKLLLDERNYVAIDHDKADAKTVSAIFEADWTGTDPDLSCTRLVVSPVSSAERLLALITSAQKSLHIESLELASQDLIDAIIERKSAGRDVQVILADPTWSKGSVNAQTAATLAAAGIPVRWIPKKTMLIHVKSIIVDGKRAYMGSENLTDTSLDHNREIGLVVTDHGPVATMESTFAADFSSARTF